MHLAKKEDWENEKLVDEFFSNPITNAYIEDLKNILEKAENGEKLTTGEANKALRLWKSLGFLKLESELPNIKRYVEALNLVKRGALPKDAFNEVGLDYIKLGIQFDKKNRALPEVLKNLEYNPFTWYTGLFQRAFAKPKNEALISIKNTPSWQAQAKYLDIVDKENYNPSVKKEEKNTQAVIKLEFIDPEKEGNIIDMEE